MAKQAKRGTVERAQMELEELGSNTAGVAGHILFSKVASLIVAGIAFVLVSRLLGPGVYGIYGLAASIAGIFISLGGLGISTALPKFIAEYKAKRQQAKLEQALSSGFVVIAASGIILTALCIAFGGQIAQFVFHNPSYYYLVDIVSITITVSMLYDASYSALVGFGKRSFLVKLTLIQVGTQAIVSIALVLLHFGALGPVIGVISGLAIGSAVGIGAIYASEGVKIRPPDSQSMRRMLYFTLPIGVYLAFSGVVSNAANIILGEFASSTIVGNVVLALKMQSVIALAVDSVAIALLPLFASLQKKKHIVYTSKLYNYSISLMMLFVLPFIFAVCVLAWNITVIFWPTWIQLPYYVVISSIGIIFLLLTQYTLALLLSRDKVMVVAKYSVIIYLLELAVLFLLVPMFKGYGLIVTVSLFTPILTFIVYLMLAKRHLSIHLEMNKLLRIAVASLVIALMLAVITLVLKTSSVEVIVASLVVMLLVYPPLVSILGGVTANDLRIIKSLSKTIPGIGAALSLLSDYAMRFKRHA